MDTLTVVAPTSSRIVASGDKWRCIMCGKCCTTSFGQSWLDLVRPDGDCGPQCSNSMIFKDSTICLINRDKPEACRLFPFTMRKNPDMTYSLVLYSGCPGFGKGRRINVENKVHEIIKFTNKKYGIHYRLHQKPSENNIYELLK